MNNPVVLFVCWGNICRSPMAEMVARARATQEGIRNVRFASAGVSAEEAGHEMDPRAVQTLTRAGYPVQSHQAHKVTTTELRDAAMVIGMEPLHLRKLKGIAPEVHPLYLMSDFDPDSVPGALIEDPWYGDESDFQTTLAQIEAAMPELMRRARELSR